MRMLMVAFVALVVTACASVPTNEELGLNFGFDKEAQLAAATASTCSSPAPATIHVGSDFKYGCFCGGGYPNLQLPPVESESVNEYSVRVVHAYYGIKPVDDLDQYCLRHDVCYILNTESMTACNAVFMREIDSLRSGLRSEIKLRKLDSVDSSQFRCGVMINDISMATIFMPQSSRTAGIAVGSKIGRGPSTIIIGGPILIRKWGSPILFGQYPKAGELCSLQAT